MPAKPYSLRRKLLTWLLLPLLILLSLRAGYTYFYANQLSNRVYDRMLFTLTIALSQQISYDSANRRIQLTDAAVQLLLSDELDSLYFSVRDAQGRVIAGERTMPPLPTELNRNELPFFDGRIGMSDIRIAYFPLTFDHEAYLLEVAETLNKRKLLSREVQIGSLIPQALIIILATIIVWFGVGKSLSPLERLNKAISERSHLDLSPVHEDEISAEVQPLIHSINDLMARLSDALEVQNRFIADAAHQLRTPLAGLKTQIELALRLNDATKTSETIHSLLASTNRMTRLVNQLLALARNEPNAEGALNKQPLDLAHLASSITMEWVPHALERDIDLGFEAPKQRIPIQADAARIKDLLDNLIDNAVRYSPQHGRITVSVIDEPRPQLTVTDNGPGIPPELRERVFERFYSLLGNGADGSGLGLAIVREIARMHGANAHIDTGQGGIGTRVCISF
ncbi:MAG TPA: sensor histidine kinase N-terminal domain-containing protein [Gammaproteobacteria bacterium]|jgi:two-component system sensor histidine kinase TctE|nr:sensor histidine kinase N-terminal domain-containing protein [Gammaproteobacteria bacterium]